ncbi:MAG: S8 family serine peptidase [Deltaproteobacteria bacterium]|nr:S8 family serine peptidase [Deltaproteobacteria bacterium]
MQRSRLASKFLLPLAALSLMALAGGCDKGGGGSVGGGASPSDPLYSFQWHLKNTGQDGGTAGEDANVEGVWASYKGSGVRIAVVDDGVEITHEDLADNVLSGAGYDYVDGDSTPDGAGAAGAMRHGTSVAGVAAAVGFNGKGVRGAAPSASLVGYNLLMNLTDANAADAMNRGLAANDIYNNSWGPPDGTGLLDDSSSVWRAAIENGLATGRGGKGAVYLWAAGNGDMVDNSNYDGNANYRGVFAVGALNDKGKKSSYSEKGANLLVSAHAGEFCDTNAVTTTDLSGAAGESPDNYTHCFNGTSAATPLASGVAALMLEANPNLTWRDVRQILAETARKNDPTEADWTTNGAGLHINHNYGFGAVDAAAAVNAATAWTNMAVEKTPFIAVSAPNLPIEDAPSPDVLGAPAVDSITVSGSGMTAVEFVEVTFTSGHAYFGDLMIAIVSPAGTVSVLSEAHVCYDSADPPNQAPCGALYSAGWRFGVARLLGESADGQWVIGVYDGGVGDIGTLQSWGLKIYGR